MKAALQVTLSAIKAPMTRAQTAEFEVRFIALMTGLPIATVEEMDCEDFARVFRECGPLYEPETSSCKEA